MNHSFAREHKKREEKFISLTKFRSSSLRLRFVKSYKSSLYSLYSFKSQIILFYLNLLCCFNFLNSLNSILVSCFVLLLRRHYDRLKWTTKTRSKCVLFRSESDLDHKKDWENDVWTKIHDAARMSRLLYTKSFSHERSCWKDIIVSPPQLVTRNVVTVNYVDAWVKWWILFIRWLHNVLYKWFSISSHVRYSAHMLDTRFVT
jgi:hypothetical protein